MGVVGPSSHPCPFRIVGIGASAGGLESLEELFSALPQHPGMAFVVVQHLSPDFKSMMDELLARHCRMPIHLAEHEMPVERDHVYLLPSGKEMIIRDRRLLLTDKDRSQSLTLPIDQFFRSLANDCGAAAVGVVLSGSGSDGSRGVRDIDAAGGQVIVETPESAQFNGMPLSALATGAVDQVARPDQIATLLLALGNAPAVAERPSEAGDDSPTAAILDLLRHHFGLDFSLYKTSTVSRRVLRRLEMTEIPSLEDYADRLRTDTVELGRLYHDLLIGVTRFFRDPAAFAVLERQVIPEIIEKTPWTEEIRVWVAGCATGEEAYSIAMIVYEQLLAAGRPPHLKVLATDVHRESLAHASAGIYDEEQLEHVSEVRRERFFTQRGRQFTIATDLRQHVVFAQHNVTRDAPFTKMHLIACRNLLIYLEPHAQKMVLSLFHFGLATGGALFLGSSETPGELLPEFAAVDEHWRIYRKRRDVRLIQPDRLAPPRRTTLPAPAPTGSPRAMSADAHLLGVYDQLLDRCMPPALLFGEDRSLVDSFAGAERYLRIRPRRPSMSVDLLAGDLRTVVTAAVHRALTRPEQVRYDGVPATDTADGERVTVTAEAFTNSRTQSKFVLVRLEPQVVPERPAAGATLDTSTSSELAREHLATLEADLLQTRERLQSTVEELQTSNEELQATNEELVASNEELQSTNEELHSVNEELYTVNAEHQRKIVELRVLNSDIQHLLESTDIGMIFLDRDLCVRKYTPRVASIFHLEPGDIGRSIRHFSHTLERPGLLDDIQRALAEGTIVEEEVASLDGTPYFLRILPYQPYRTGEHGMERGGSIGEGVVVSLTDISALGRAHERIRHLSNIVDSSEDAILAKSLDGTITAWNPGAERLYGYAAEEAIGQNVRILAAPQHAGEIDGLLAQVKTGKAIEHFDTLRRRKDGTLLELSISISPLRDRSGSVIGAASIARDVSPLRHAQRELAAREERIRLLLDSTAESIYGVDVSGVVTFCNAACLRALGQPGADDLIGQPVERVIQHGSAVDHANGNGNGAADHPARRVLRAGEPMHETDAALVRADGSRFPVEYWSYPILGEAGVIGAVVTFIDITERMKAEAEIREAARRREQFLAMLSHELRNPLAAIVSATQVLRHAAVQPAIVAHTRDVIARQSAHMGRLLDDLLDVARITRGGIELRKSDIDLRAAVKVALEAATPQLRQRQIGLTVDLPDRPLPVRGDAARLQQVIGNLLSNAARYSDAGTAVDLSAAVEGRDVVLRVRDQGRGIDPAMLPVVFDLFVQGEQGLDRRGGGLGVGLTLVRQIVELHGGTVEARSDGRGHGSEFIVRLPRQEKAIVADRPTSLRASETPARRIVVAEDQADAREMVRVLLEQCGHVVLEAADGPSALAVIERGHPDVALIDIGLPKMNGYELARRIRANPQLDDVLLVALTGYGTSADVEQARASGFDEHLTKPCDLERLNDAIRQRRSPAAPTGTSTQDAAYS